MNRLTLNPATLTTEAASEDVNNESKTAYLNAWRPATARAIDLRHFGTPKDEPLSWSDDSTS